jgi:hypothetical protein
MNMEKVQQKIKIGNKVICLKSGKNNSDMIAGKKYIVSEVDEDGMIKLKGHLDWWSPERFKKLPVDK